MEKRMPGSMRTHETLSLAVQTRALPVSVDIRCGGASALGGPAGVCQKGVGRGVRTVPSSARKLKHAPPNYPAVFELDLPRSGF